MLSSKPVKPLSKQTPKKQPVEKQPAKQSTVESPNKPAKENSKAKLSAKRQSQGKTKASSPGHSLGALGKSKWQNVDMGAGGDGPHNDSRSRPDSDPIALHFHDLTLRSSDIRLLQGPHWLSDRLLSFYCAYLQQTRYRSASDELLFLSPAVAQCMRHMEPRDLRRMLGELQASSKQFIFFPLTDNATTSAGGTHWSLLLLARPDRKFYHYDSRDNCNLATSRQFFERVRVPLGAGEAHFVVGRCLQQSNNYDCGIHVMCMTDHVADYAVRCGYASSTLLISFQQVRGMRAKLLQLIQQLGGIVPSPISRRRPIVPK